jgi:hypothetical protein
VGKGGNGNQRRFPEGCPRLIKGEVRRVYGAPHWKRLADAGGGLGRYRRLSLRRWLAVSVAQQPGRDGLGFRPGETETGLAWVGTRRQGAGRWWQGVDGTVPCWFGRRATRV